MGTDRAGLYAALKRHYRAHGIGAEDFHCAHWCECSGGSPTATTAAEPHIGPHFGEGLPRLVFLSLDSGSDISKWGGKGVERMDSWQPGDETGATGLQKTRHWYRTCEMAQRILGGFDQQLDNLRTDDLAGYFAHLNSARCSQNKPGRKEADPRLFDNCRQFLGPEVEIIAPDILITQG